MFFGYEWKVLRALIDDWRYLTELVLAVVIAIVLWIYDPDAIYFTILSIGAFLAPFVHAAYDFHNRHGLFKDLDAYYDRQKNPQNDLNKIEIPSIYEKPKK